MHISFESLCVREKTLKVLPTKLLVIYTQLLFYFFNIIYIYIYKKVQMFSKNLGIRMKGHKEGAHP